MKICYDYQIFAAQRYGGISRYFYEIASRISQFNGHDVKIISPLYVNQYIRRGSLAVGGIYFPHISHTGRFINRINRTFSKPFYQWLRAVDVFHETYYANQEIKLKRAAHVVTVHDMTPEKFPEHFRQPEVARDIKITAVSRADHVICVSENTRRDLIDIFGVDERNTSVVYHGSSLLPTDSPKEKFTGHRPYILYIGGRWRYKNFERLLRAYACSYRLSSEFDLYCFGGGKFGRSELAIMESLKIKKRSVKQFSGNDKTLAELYTSATAFVFPSLYEGFGIPLLEAMSLGCPIVCANSGSLPEIASDAAHMFDPTDVESIRVAIERVVFSEDYRQDLVHRGYLRSALFSWDKCARQTLDVYCSLTQ